MVPIGGATVSIGSLPKPYKVIGFGGGGKFFACAPSVQHSVEPCEVTFEKKGRFEPGSSWVVFFTVSMWSHAAFDPKSRPEFNNNRQQVEKTASVQLLRQLAAFRNPRNEKEKPYGSGLKNGSPILFGSEPNTYC